MRISDWSSDVCSSDLIPKDAVIGKEQIKSASYADCGCDSHESARPSHESIDLRNAQSGAGTGLGGEEGIEDFAPDVLRHAHTIIPHANADRKSTRLNSSH